MSGAPTSRVEQFDFSQGLQQYRDRRHVVPPQLVTLENARQVAPGTIEKRWGTVTHMDTCTAPFWLTDGYALGATSGAELSVADDALVYAGREGVVALESRGNSAFVFRGFSPWGTCKTRAVWASSDPAQGTATGLSRFNMRDVAVGTAANGRECYAVTWYGGIVGGLAISGGVVMVFDAETHQPIDTETAVSGYPGTLNPLMWTVLPWARLIWLGTDLYVLTAGVAANSVYLWRLDTSTWTWTRVSTTVLTDASQVGERTRLDAVAYSSTQILIAYQTTANALKVLRINTSGTVVATVTSAEPAVAVNAISVALAEGGAKVWVAYVNNTPQGRVTVVSTSGWTEDAGYPRAAWNAGALGITRPVTSAVYATSAGATLFYGDLYDTPVSIYQRYARVRAISMNNAGTSDAYPSDTYHAMLVGRPFPRGSGNNLLIPCITGGAGQAEGTEFGRLSTVGCQYSYALMEYVKDRPEEMPWSSGVTNMPMFLSHVIVPRVAATFSGQTNFTSSPYVSCFAPCSTPALADGTRLSIYPQVLGFSVGGGDDVRKIVREQLTLAMFDINDTSHMRAAPLADVACFSGFTIGKTMVEAGFLHRPEAITLSATAAGNVDIGTHYYYAVYALQMPNGDVIRSAPSNQLEVVVSASAKQNTLSVPLPATTYAWMFHNDRSVVAFVELYRTTVADPDTIYLVARSAYIDPGAAFVSVVDNTADSGVTGFPQLYTGTATVQAYKANVCSPSLRHTTVHRDRVFGIDPDGRTVWYTDKLTRGEHPQFHDEQTLRVERPIHTLASLDYSLLAFGDEYIYALSGDGPSERYPGSDSDYSGFHRLASDVGCTDPGSPCVTQEGVVFRSKTGLTLLLRNLAVQPFGLEVKDELDAYPYHTRIVLHPTKRWLYVTANSDAAGSSGIRLVYDYILKTWAKDYVTAGDAADGFMGPTVRGSDVYWISPESGAVYKEDRTSYFDVGSSWITMKATLGVFRPQGAVGFQGVQSFHLLLEKYSADAGLALTADYDYATSASTDTKSISSATIAAYTTPLTHIKWSLKKKEVLSTQVTIADASSGSADTGRGFRWVAYGFDWEPKKQPFPLPAAQQV